jgi:hypothetical protein
MIAGSDRVVPHTDEGLGDEVRASTLRFDSPDDAAPKEQRALFGALRQSRRFSEWSRRLCCERTVNRQGYISKQLWRAGPI